MDSVLPETVAAPTNPSIPILPVISSTTWEQVTTVAQPISTLSEAPYIVSSSTLDRGIAYQRQSSNERPAETDMINRAGPESRKISDTTQPVTVAVLVTNPVESQPVIHPPTGSNAPRRDAKDLDSGSAVPQDSSAASGSDPKTAILPALERTDDRATAPNTGSLAFAARLTPSAEVQQLAPEPVRPTETLPRLQTPLQFATPVTAKQIATGADLPADARSSQGGGQSDKENTSDRFAKPNTILPVHSTLADQPAISANSHVATSPLSPAALLDQIIDPPAAARNTSHDITVRIPDSTDQGTAVRFVERAGEIHVSVRTGDVEVAQTLRGGLNDLVSHLQDDGIRTQVWQPDASSNTASQNDSHQPFADPDGSNGRQHPAGSNAGQESKEQNKPRWVEELEGSIGNPNFKETTQLPWQA